MKSNFEETPPGWLRKSRIYARELKATGTEVKWKESRIGNALLKRGIFACDPMPFRPQLQAREDQDFFRRKIQSGYRFIWSAEGLVSETIAPEHWKRAFILRNAFQEGAMAALQPDCTKTSIAQSLIAVPFYTLFAPLALLAGQQYFMRLLVKIFEHSGKLLMSAGIDPKKEE